MANLNQIRQLNRIAEEIDQHEQQSAQLLAALQQRITQLRTARTFIQGRIAAATPGFEASQVADVNASLSTLDAGLVSLRTLIAS